MIDKNGAEHDELGKFAKKSNTLFDDCSDIPDIEKETQTTPLKNSKPKSYAEFAGEEFKGLKGIDAIHKLMDEKHGHVKGAFHREGLGDIDIVWGDDKAGLKHMIQERVKQGISISRFIYGITETIENGIVFPVDDRGGRKIHFNKNIVVVSLSYRGEKSTYVLSAYRGPQMKTEPKKGSE